MLTEEELDLVTIEVATTDLDEDTFIQETPWGVPIVYYMIDTILIGQGILEPLHFPKKGFELFFGKRSEEELFERALQNTVNIFRIKGKTLAEYYRELEVDPVNVKERKIIRVLAEAMERTEIKNQPLCITGKVGIRSAVGALSKKVLRKMCRKFGAKGLIIGICNNDFALVFQDLPENMPKLKRLMQPYEMFLEGSGDIQKKVILQYQLERDTLTRLQ